MLCSKSEGQTNHKHSEKKEVEEKKKQEDEEGEEDEEVQINFTKQEQKTTENFSIKASKITFYHQKFLLKFLDQGELVPVSEGLQVAAEEIQP